jgi:hypothetical protein
VGLVKKMLEKSGLKDEGQAGILKNWRRGERMSAHRHNAWRSIGTRSYFTTQAVTLVHIFTLMV